MRWLYAAVSAILAGAVALTLTLSSSPSSTSTTGSGLTATTTSSPATASTSSSSSTLTTGSGLTTTTSSPATTSTTVSPEFQTRSGIFVSGWNTCGTAAGVYYQQTFVGPFEAGGVVTHRIEEIRCDDNEPFVYLQVPATPNEISAGTFDEFLSEWFAEYFTVCGVECILAPLPEMNGPWVPWYSAVPAETIAAWNHIRSIGEPLGETTWAYAPSQYYGWKDYAPDDFDLLAPSVYDANGELSALDVIGRVATMIDYFDAPAILAQTGTQKTGTARDEWILELHRLATRERVLGVIMFDHDGNLSYTYPGGLLNSDVYQEVLSATENE